jgi:hypothetical protein
VDTAHYRCIDTVNRNIFLCLIYFYIRPLALSFFENVIPDPRPVKINMHHDQPDDNKTVDLVYLFKSFRIRDTKCDHRYDLDDKKDGQYRVNYLMQF